MQPVFVLTTNSGQLDGTRSPLHSGLTVYAWQGALLRAASDPVLLAQEESPWPCRVWEAYGVEVKDASGTPGYRWLTIGKQLKPYKVFGPQGEAVVDILTKAASHNIGRYFD